MQVNLVNAYDEAASCLEVVVSESRKESGINLKLMLDSCKRCRHLINYLKLTDDSERQPALEQLCGMVEYFTGALTTKTQQVEKVCQGSLQHPEDHSSASTNRETSEKTRKLAIEDTILQKGSRTNIKFEDVAGLSEAKQALREAIIMPLQYPHLFTEGLKPWRRILLYGPPGTGKSRLARAISAEISSTFYCVSSSDLVSSWVGESEKLIKELFVHATCQPGTSVVFIDEIDSICRKRSSREEEHTRRIKTELLKQMEGADNSDKQDKIFLLCATNCPWELDSAFLRRFQKRIYIPLPDREARVSLIKIHCKKNPVSLTDPEWHLLADRTENYSGSDIANAIMEAMFRPIRCLHGATHWKQTEGNKIVPCPSNEPGAIKATLAELPSDQVLPRKVLLEDFLSSLSCHRHTVTSDELAKFENFTQDFGQNG